MKDNTRQTNLFEKTAYLVLALFPVAIIAVFFLQKILMMKRFVFGDDFQMLKYFTGGPIAFPLWEIVKFRIKDGRFYPLYYQNFNLVSLLYPDLTLNNLAERCFYVQAGMWCLTCIVFFLLMTCIAKMGREKFHPALWLFLPLALLTLLCSQAFVSYFLMLVLAETLLCVLFPLFFLFYILAYKKENRHIICSLGFSRRSPCTARRICLSFSSSFAVLGACSAGKR